MERLKGINVHPSYKGQVAWDVVVRLVGADQSNMNWMTKNAVNVRYGDFIAIKEFMSDTLTYGRVVDCDTVWASGGWKVRLSVSTDWDGNGGNVEKIQLYPESTVCERVFSRIA